VSEFYIEIPIETDPELLAQEAFDYLEASMPDWEPNDANLETIIIETMARMTSEARDVASAVPVDIFRYFGELVGVVPQDATFATGLTNWTVINNAGYTIPDGTQVGIQVTGDLIEAFQTVGDTVIPPGFTTASNVQIRANEAGTAASGITGSVTLLDTLDFVTAIVLNAPTTGGLDAETDDDYINRLSLRLQLLAPRPILARDFAIFAQDIAGVERAVAIDNYDPGPPPVTNAERAVTVAVTDANGMPVSAAIKTEVDNYLEAAREVNFLVFVVDPTYTTIDVQFTAVAYQGFDPADVETRAEQAVADYLSPANWGFPTALPTEIHIPVSPTWVNETVIRYLELSQVINSVFGINYIEALTFRVAAGTYASTDITLTGVVPLPQPGTIAGTVHL
jgi:Baseplate J-like protein